ncbi:MAG: 2-amino-4-hydroxy-6-hydroxymethyldihydropteridine diphosphokinase [Betaproteobacteria bacterium]|nr:2-amino-4-hydroxy-6-hydroxymethyldihydropteridine diphosphokinase [Betaproteobacteria bacterium]
MSAQPVVAFLALGSNLDAPREQVVRGMAEIAALPATRLLKRSSLYRTAPVGFLDQPDFINAVMMVETALAPHALLDGLLDIERRHGRVRDFPNAPRTLDLDLLLYGDLVLHEPGLTLPHPRMHERAFVLQPLAEIAADTVIPGQGRVADLLRECPDQRLERLDAA